MLAKFIYKIKIIQLVRFPLFYYTPMVSSSSSPSSMIIWVVQIVIIINIVYRRVLTDRELQPLVQMIA